MMLRLKGILILILLKLCEKCGFTNGWICSTIVTYYAFILGGVLYGLQMDGKIMRLLILPVGRSWSVGGIIFW